MYKITVPYCLHKNDHRELCSERVVRALKRLSADRIAVFYEGWTDYESGVPIIQKACEYFASYGISTALWINGFMHESVADFKKMRFLDGREATVPCTLDENFRAFYATAMSAYANCDLDFIFIDDDFRIHDCGGVACFCDLHLKKYKEELGEFTREELIEGIKSPYPNKFRSAWIKINGETLRDIAKYLRKKINEVNPKMRLGVCTSPNTIDLDGITGCEIAKHLAGDTKPLLRLIGAPYWARNRNRINEPMGIERVLLNEFKDFDGEIIVEGDVYTRPRYSVPASYLQNFDEVLRTEARCDGILKYSIDYYSDIDYETGYYIIAENRENVAKLIREKFNCAHTGFCVKEHIKQVENMTIPSFPKRDLNSPLADIEWLGWRAVELSSTKMLGDLSIPYCFNESEPWVVLGENGRYFDPNSALIDLRSARFMKERGIDCGLVSDRRVNLADLMLGDNCVEKFKFSSDVAVIHCMPAVYDITLREGAQVCSTFVVDGNEYVASYCYKNASGKRFFVLCYDADEMKYGFGINRNYYKQRNLLNAYEYLSGKKMDAEMTGNPDLYIVTARRADELLVAFWNNHADYIDKPFIKINGAFDGVECFGCVGEAVEGGIALERVHAFEGGFVSVKNFRK